MPIERAEKLKVVLDTNVYISAFTHRQGIAFQVWLLAATSRYKLVASPAIIKETAEVLRRDFYKNDVEVIKIIKLISKVAEIVLPTTELKVITQDPDDNAILECAITGEAHLIISGDHHLLRLKSYQKIGIIRPIDLLRIIK